jgi:hypothetical protein
MSAAAPVWEPSLPSTLTQFILNLERSDAAYAGNFCAEFFERKNERV